MSCGNSIPSDKDVVSALKEYEKIEHKLDVDLFGGLKSSIPVQITYKSIKTIGCTSVNSSEAICSVNVEGTSSAINGMLNKNFSEVEKFRLYRVDGVWRTEEAIKSNNSSNSNQSNSIKQSNNDGDKISSIRKNGIDGWGFAQEVFGWRFAQEVFSKSGDDSLLLLNPNDKNSFRVISYYSYIQYNAKHTKIIGDKIIPMAETFKIMSLNEEADPNFKKSLHYEDKILLKKQGWNFIRYYYENANKCSSNAYVYDYYNANLNKIKKVTYCNGVKTEQILEPYVAEQIYVKSGMGKGE
jgi:hypothetical protein